MSSQDVIALNRARTTFQRVNDAKFFNGWVRHITPDQVIVRTSSSCPLVPGDDFAFQVYGHRKDAFFHATLTLLSGTDKSAQFASDRNSSANHVELRCEITTEMCFKDGHGQPRFCVEGVSADVILDDERRSDGSFVLDIGPTGFAVLTLRHFKKGDMVHVNLWANGQLVQCEAEVRNSIVNAINSRYQRTGFLIKRMDRIDALRWKQLYHGILEMNKMQCALRVAELGTTVKLKSKDAA